MPRQNLEQTFLTQPLSVPTINQVQIAPSINLNNQIIAFMICNFSTNANSVFWGSNPVSTTSGIEITPGSAPLFTIDEVRQLYEIQTSAENLASMASCQMVPSTLIPLVVWNPANIWIIAANAITPVTIGLFYNVYS
jgi:hypothetical protein